MESNSKKNGGFGLIEVVISMAIMGIISVSVYTGYILSIKHTKEGQVKQEAALQGKKVVEEIKSTTALQLPTSDNGTITIGDIDLTKYQKADGTSGYKTYLDQDFNADADMSEDLRKYTEIVTITPTKAADSNESSSEDVNLNVTQYQQGTNDINCEVYMSNNKMQDNSIKNYISDDEKNLYEKELEERQGKITLYMYVETEKDNSRTITINDIEGNVKFNKNISFKDSTSTGKINIVVNFANYKNSSAAIPMLINVYNKTSSDVPNIYLQKSSDLSVDVEAFQGKFNLYDNRIEDLEMSKFGQLYDIEVDIKDYIEDKAGSSDNLFTAYYKQNIQ